MKRYFTLDSQVLSAMQLCMRRYKYEHLEHWKPTSAAALEIGSLMHSMLDFYYTALKFEDRWERNGHTHAMIVDIAVSIAQKMTPKMNLSFTDAEMIIATFRVYAEYYRERGDWRHILTVERVGSRLLHDSDDLAILYTVKIDLIVRHGMQMPMLGIDHKTYSRWSNPVALNNQFMGYCWFLNSNHFMINRIGLQKTLPSEQKFRRVMLQYSDEQLEEWRENAVATVRLALAAIETEQFQMNLTSCDKFGGCSYLKICDSLPSTRDLRLRTFYTQQVWDPGAKL